MWKTITAIAVVIILILIWLWVDCRTDLRECEKDLAACEAQTQGGGQTGAAAFEFVIDLDASGTFMPLNNQFDTAQGAGPPVPPASFRRGFFAQLGNFTGAVHVWDYVYVKRSGATSYDRIPRSDVKWLDITCGTESTPITLAQAKTLLPASAADTSRLLHHNLNAAGIVLATLWRGPEEDDEMSVTSEQGQGTGTHGHEKFVFSSPDECTVRIWKDLDAASSPEVIPDPADPTDTRVVEIKIVEENPPVTHGSPHYPPWGLGGTQ